MSLGGTAEPLLRTSVRGKESGQGLQRARVPAFLILTPPHRAFPIYAWLEERLEIQAFSDDLTSKFVPPHVNVFYCFGGLVFTAFVAQFLSGALLSVYFRPAVADSLLPALLAGAPGGWLARAAHRLGANLVLLFMVLHICRVFFTGGHFRPRELSWLTGALLSLLAGAASVTGYTLPWDQVGFWAFQIVSAIPASLDLYTAGAGAALTFLLRGGAALGQAALSRCAFAHTLLLPALSLGALLLHFLCIRKQGISGPL